MLLPGRCCCYVMMHACSRAAVLLMRMLPPRLPAGLSASELYVVKTGEFEVLQRRKVRLLRARAQLRRSAMCDCCGAGLRLV